MFYTTLLCDASGNERVIAYIGDGKNLELLLEAIKNPDLTDDIDVAIASYKEAAHTQTLFEGEYADDFASIKELSTFKIYLPTSRDAGKSWTLDDLDLSLLFSPITSEEDDDLPASPLYFHREPRQNAAWCDAWQTVSSENVICTIAEEPLWTEEELEQILVISEPDELDTPAISWRNPQKGQRRNDHGWISKRQWQKGYDNRVTRHETRAALAIVRRSFSK